METAGDRPSMKSTSGLSICPRNCLAYADRDSTYLRCPSAKIVSKARLDLPDPDSPVNTIMASRGRSREMSFRLCSRAPRTTSRSATARSSLRQFNPGSTQRLAIVARGSDISARLRKPGFIAPERPPLCPRAEPRPRRACRTLQTTARRAWGPALLSIASRYGCAITVVGIANARDGFVYDERGLDLGSVLAAAESGRPITDQRGARAWPGAIEGLRGTEADLLVEVTASPPAGGEPGLTHMREALQRRIAVVTSNKWPVALHGAELAALARRQGVAFRAESTVMSGTPVLSALAEGMAGAVPGGLRGVLNATANAILSRMADGIGYADALAEAQRAGLAEPDPAADVEGHDAAAKVMILSALVFGRQLTLEQVACRGI